MASDAIPLKRTKTLFGGRIVLRDQLIIETHSRTKVIHCGSARDKSVGILTEYGGRKRRSEPEDGKDTQTTV